MNEKTPNGIIVIALAAIGWVLLIMPESDQQQERIDQQHYCKMVKLWNDNKHLSKEERPGWPPYKGECHGD